MVEINSVWKYHLYLLNESDYESNIINQAIVKSASALIADIKSTTSYPTTFTIDESCYLKKDIRSVGVACQYFEKDNCQVVLCGSLSNEIYSTLVDIQLFFPQEWASDTTRLEAAHIPASFQKYKTKEKLALEIIDRAICQNVGFDCICGGLSSQNSELTRALDHRGLFYVLDIHKDEHVFLEEPHIFTTLMPDSQVSLEDYCKGLSPSDWKKVEVFKTIEKTWSIKVHIAKIWHWNEEETHAYIHTLVITFDPKDKLFRYSFSNGSIHEYTAKEYAWFQCSKFCVDRCFDECKNEIGLSGYSIRGWNAWQHHITLAMADNLYQLQQEMKNREL